MTARGRSSLSDRLCEGVWGGERVAITKDSHNGGCGKWIGKETGDEEGTKNSNLGRQQTAILDAQTTQARVLVGKIENVMQRVAGCGFSLEAGRTRVEVPLVMPGRAGLQIRLVAQKDSVLNKYSTTDK